MWTAIPPRSAIVPPGMSQPLVIWATWSFIARPL